MSGRHPFFQHALMRKTSLENEFMKHLIVGAALIAALGAAPVLAKEKKAMQSGEASQQMNYDNMYKGPDGELQGKPVVEGPANWANVKDSSASTGASSGESGSASDKDSGSR
jgi:hypothetical protein